MDPVCSLFESTGSSESIQPETDLMSLENASSKNLSILFYQQRNGTDLHGGYEGWNFQDWYDNVLIPCLCVFGIMGNLFNLVIFGKKFKEGKTSDFNQKCVADHCFVFN